MGFLERLDDIFKNNEYECVSLGHTVFLGIHLDLFTRGYLDCMGFIELCETNPYKPDGEIRCGSAGLYSSQGTCCLGFTAGSGTAGSRLAATSYGLSNYTLNVHILCVWAISSIRKQCPPQCLQLKLY